MNKDRDRAIEQLKHLWEEAHSLADAEAVMDKRFHVWREQTLAALADIYGADSGERSQFEAIRFEIDPKLLDSAKRSPGPLADHGFDVSKVKIDIDHKRYYAKRLSDAAELLLSFVIGLRQCG